MKKFFSVSILLISIVFCFAYASASELSGDESIEIKSNESVVMLSDVVEKKDGFKLNGNWIFEGYVGNEIYSQKKYFLMSNPKVYILCGNTNLMESLNKIIPIQDTSFESLIKDENLAEIIGVAAGSECTEKEYGDKVFYEYKKTQQNSKNETINSVLDFFVEDGILYTFSYNHIGEQEDIQDYIDALEKFETPNSDVKTARNGRSSLVYNQAEYEEIVETPKKSYNGLVVGGIIMVSLIIIICTIILVGYKITR